MSYKPYDTLLDKIAYISGLIVLFIGTSGIFVISFFHIDINNYVLPCTLNYVTGFYCPGCGGTRALKYLLAGDILQSLRYNPIIVYVFFPWIWFLITHSIYRITGRVKNDLPQTSSVYKYTRILRNGILRPITVRPWYIYSGIIILLLQCLIKNILLLHHIDILA